MGFFNKLRNDGRTHDGQGEERKGMIDRIVRSAESDKELAWKFPYDNLSIGAQLIVHPGQEAVFVKGGVIADVFGPDTHTLSANNLPILQKLVNLPFGGRTPFTAEVWFIDKRPHAGLFFGTPSPIPLLDPLYGISVPVRCRGSFAIRITDSVTFLTDMVGAKGERSTEYIEDFFGGIISDRIGECISMFIAEQQVSIAQINARRTAVRDYAQRILSEQVVRYGIALEQFNIENIDYDKNSAEGKILLESQATDAATFAERRRMGMLGYNYQQERQFDVMQTAAGNEGGAGQMMGAGMGLGMGVGIGGAMGTQMSGIAAGTMNAQPVPPPPPAAVSYHVLVNNVQQGPFNLQQLQQMAQQGTLTPDSYVWANGMPQWAAASSRPDLAPLFGAAPPPPPPPVV